MIRAHAPSLAVLALLFATPSAMAAPSMQTPPVAAALVAKIIGETCPNSLTALETSEISRYLDHTIAIEKAKGPDEKALTERLVADLDLDFRNNRTCGVGDMELARDILGRVRHEAEVIP